MPTYVADALSAGVKVIDFPTPQSTILFGHAGIPRKDDDFCSLPFEPHSQGAVDLKAV